MVAPAPAPASSLEVDGTQLLLGYLGVGTALLLIGSPIPTFWRIVKTKQVGEEEPYSYMSVLFNAAACVIYGLPVFADKTNKPVMLANGVGVFLELVYVILFIMYVAGERRRNHMIILIGVVVAIMALLGLLLGTVFFGHVWTRTYMGWIAMLSGVAMYLAPIFKTVGAWKNSDRARLSVIQSMAALANGTMWTAYALVGRHIIWFTLVPSVVGIGSAGFRVIVWLILYCREAQEGEGARAQRRGGSNLQMSLRQPQGQRQGQGGRDAGGEGRHQLPPGPVVRPGLSSSCSLPPSSSSKEKTARASTSSTWP
ncbi:hypothetical protein D1007_60509 [Hordeum vulgare]|nr:hypothetical protein D1007_60509 [Hordeum vulgare]